MSSTLKQLQLMPIFSEHMALSWRGISPTTTSAVELHRQRLMIWWKMFDASKQDVVKGRIASTNLLWRNDKYLNSSNIIRVKPQLLHHHWTISIELLPTFVETSIPLQTSPLTPTPSTRSFNLVSAWLMTIVIDTPTSITRILQALNGGSNSRCFRIPIRPADANPTRAEKPLHKFRQWLKVSNPPHTKQQFFADPSWGPTPSNQPHQSPPDIYCSHRATSVQHLFHVLATRNTPPRRWRPEGGTESNMVGRKLSGRCGNLTWGHRYYQPKQYIDIREIPPNYHKW